MGNARRGLLGLCGVFLSCTVSDVDRAAAPIRTLEGGRLVVRYPTPGDIPNLRFVEERRLGTATGDGPSAFGRIRSVAADRWGNIHVYDQISEEVNSFSVDGRFLRRVSRAGGGPGELRNSFVGAHLLWREPSELWIATMGHIMVFDSIGQFLREFAAPNSSGGLYSAWPVRATDSLGHVYALGQEAQSRGWPPINIRHERIERYALDDDGELLARGELSIGRIESRGTAAGGGVFTMEELPMRPTVLWAPDPSGDVWVARSDSYRIHRLTFRGDTVATVELARSQERLEGAERDSIAATVEKVYSIEELPKTKPVMSDLYADTDGWLWVRRREGASATDAWDVFDDCMRFVGWAIVPLRLARRPLVPLGSAGLLAVARDALDIDYIVHLRLARPDGRPISTGPCDA